MKSKTRRKALQGSNSVPLSEQFFCQCAESDCGKWTAVQKNPALEFCGCARGATREICQRCNLPLFRCNYGLEVIQIGVKDPCNESCDYCIWLQEGEDACDCLESVEACNDPAKQRSHHVLQLIQRFMDKASPGGPYLVHGKGGLPESILVGSNEKIILDCNSVFCVKEAQMNTMKSGIDGGLCGDHNLRLSTSLWVSSASQSIDHITKQPKKVPVTSSTTRSPKVGVQPRTHKTYCVRDYVSSPFFDPQSWDILGGGPRDC